MMRSQGYRGLLKQALKYSFFTYLKSQQYMLAAIHFNKTEGCQVKRLKFCLHAKSTSSM